MLPGTELSVETWLAAVALAGVVGMDASSWPQAMVSRPVVAGGLGGWLLGDALAGLAAGAVLELLVLRHLPFGGARCPDPGPAGLVAGAAAAGVGAAGAGATAAAAAVGWGVGWLGEVSVRLQRRMAGRLLGDAEGLSGSPERLVRRHRIMIGVDFLRGAMLGAAFLVPAAVAVRAAVGRATAGGPAAALLVAGAAALAAGGASTRFASGRRGALLVAAGGAAGLLAVGVAG